MKSHELKANLINAMRGIGNGLAYDCLSNFHKYGGEQFHAYELLKELRAMNVYDEDTILELMDVVSGWCSGERRIWEHDLGSRVCLYTVDAHEVKGNVLALFPGISQDRIREYDLGWVKQGVELELRYPNDTTNTTMIRNYYVNVAPTSENKFEASKPPIVICVAGSEHVPIGTQIWCVRPI